MAFLTFNFFKIWEIDILKNSYFTIFKVKYFFKKHGKVLLFLSK